MADIHRFDCCIIGGGIIGLYVARQLAQTGRRVAIIERGPASYRESRDPEPSIVSRTRPHGGVRNARTQALGGNAHVWGGGLMRSDMRSVGGALGLLDREADAAGEDLTRDFDEVEHVLGVRRRLRREVTIIGGVPTRVGEIAVIAGRGRNVSMALLADVMKSGDVRIITDAAVTGFERGSGDEVAAVMIRTSQGIARIEAVRFVISAGAADSNLLVASHAPALGVRTGAGIGSAIHDHLSVPLYRMRSTDRHFREQVAPRFDGNLIVHRHYELEAPEAWRLESGPARGFLHFQFLFDDAAPYRQMKAMLSLRQQGASMTALARHGLTLVRELPTLGRIGIDRYIHQRLHLAGSVEIVATLDFETCVVPDNRLAFAPAGTAAIDWDVRQEDIRTFCSLRARADELLTGLSDRAERDPLGDFQSLETATAYVRREATDAYHLGGGLPASLRREGIVDLDLRLSGARNVHVISAAVFRRPGVANPTLTLLALANRFVRQLG